LFETEHIGDADPADVQNGTQYTNVASSYITVAVAKLANGELVMLNLNIKKMIGSSIVRIT